MKCACLLVTHGSRDPRHYTASEQLRLRVAQQWIVQAVSIIGTATLELGLEPLHQQMLRFVQQLEARDIHKLLVVPLFLSAGNHVMEDIPYEVELARRSLSPSFELELCPHLGSHFGWANWLIQHVLSAGHPVDRWILFAHGSHRVGAQQSLQSLAEQLRLDLAYWSVSPSLVDQVEQLVAVGYRNIGVLPYLLFPGGITDALQQTCQQLEQQFPHLNLHCLATLDTHPELATLIVDLMQTRLS